MTSEEKYLWSLTYQLHGTSCLWWAYFRDRREAEAEIGEIVTCWSCVQVGTLQEEPGGMLFVEQYYYHPTCSSQRKADLLLSQKARKRDELLLAPAPIVCDYRTSFVRSVEDGVGCERCEEGKRTLNQRPSLMAS